MKKVLISYDLVLHDEVWYWFVKEAKKRGLDRGEEVSEEVLVHRLIEYQAVTLEMKADEALNKMAS